MSKFKTMLSGFFKYKDLLKELTERDIKIRYRRSVLGLMWTILNPLLMMVVMTAVFSGFFRMEIENFPIYFFSGNILFSFMTEATTNAMNSIVGNGSMLKKVYVPKYVFPMSKVLASAVNLLFSFMAMLLVMVVTKVEFCITLLLVPIVFCYIILFSIGLGMILATSQVFFRDTGHLYSVFTLAWMYMTPVFYPKSLLEDRLDIMIHLNPMIYFIDFMRDVVLYNKIPTVEANLTCAITSASVFIVGLWFFYKKQDRFVLFV